MISKVILPLARLNHDTDGKLVQALVSTYLVLCYAVKFNHWLRRILLNLREDAS